jgi:predicted tellurium resistance membrane protein TerC
MARKTRQQMMMRIWWVKGLLAIAMLLLAYGFASLAIDSGSWLEYVVTIILVWFGVKDLFLSVRLIFSR